MWDVHTALQGRFVFEYYGYGLWVPERCFGRLEDGCMLGNILECAVCWKIDCWQMYCLINCSNVHGVVRMLGDRCWKIDGWNVHGDWKIDCWKIDCWIKCWNEQGVIQMLGDSCRMIDCWNVQGARTV